jgi:hypothetical protein
MATRRASLLMLPTLLLAAAALAQPRSFPEDAKRGYIQHVREMTVTLNGNQATLAPGAVIHNQNNLIIMPTALPPNGAWAGYVVDGNGEISRVWLLTPEEQSQPIGRQGH